MSAQQIVDFDGLLVADQGNDAEAERLSRAILFVLGLFDSRGNQRGDGESFLAIDLAVAAGAWDAKSDGVRQQAHTAGVAQRLDPPIVGNHVAELDDLRDAAEVLDKAGGAAEGLPREIVDGNLAIVEIGVGDARQVLEDEILNDAEILADGGGAHLFVVADDEHGLAKVERDERHHIALAGLVDDDHIEARDARVEIFDHARDRHNPDRHGTAALGHFPGGFRAQQGNTNAVAFADPANGVEPADQRLALAGRSAASPRRPGAAVDEVDGHAAKLFAELFTFWLQGFERNIGAAIEFVVELAPNPGCRRIARRFDAAVDARAVSDVP